MSKIIGIEITWDKELRRDEYDYFFDLNLYSYDKKVKKYIAFSRLNQEILEWKNRTIRSHYISDAIGCTGSQFMIYKYTKIFKKRIFVPSYLCNECGRSYFPSPKNGIIESDCKCGSNQWTRFWFYETALDELFKLV